MHYVVLEHDLDEGTVEVLAITHHPEAAHHVANARPLEWTREQRALEYDLVECGCLQPEEADPPTPGDYDAYYRVEVVPV